MNVYIYWKFVFQSRLDRIISTSTPTLPKGLQHGNLSLCLAAAQHALRIAHRGFFLEVRASPNLQAVGSLTLVHFFNWKVKLQRVVGCVSFSNKPQESVELNERAKLHLFGNLIVLVGAGPPTLGSYDSFLSVVNQVSSECDSIIYAAAADIEKKYTTRLLLRVEAFFRAFHDNL